MKNFVWFVLGIAGGLVAAHLLNRDPRGHEMLAEVDARINEFTDRIGDAYRDQEARLGDFVDAAKGAAVDVASATKDAASDALDAAKDAATGVASATKDAASDVVDAAKDAAAKLTD